jgi:transcriptional regulator with XRE-family HTH domain
MARRFSGRILQNTRKQRGLNRERLAVTAEISASALGRWEQDTAVPNVNAAAVLAEVLGVTVDALLGDPGPAGDDD